MSDAMQMMPPPAGTARSRVVSATPMAWREIGTFARELAHQPVLSLYIDGRVKDPAERRAWRVLVENELAALRALVAGADHDAREALAEASAQVRQYLDEMYRGAIGHPALALFATRDEVVRADSLPSPLTTAATWGNGPRIAPYACAVAAVQSALVLIVSTTDVRMVRVRGATSEPIAELDAETAMGETPTRSRGRPGGGFRAVRGTTGADELHRQREVAFERMLAVLVEAVITASGPDDLVVVGGPPEPAHAAATLLDARTPRDVVLEGGLDVHASDAEVRAAAARATGRFREQRNAERFAELLERGQATRGAAIGIMAVASALEHGAVMELLLTCGFIDEQAALADDLVASTLRQGGIVAALDGEPAAQLDAEGGVAALLRFTPIPSAFGVGWESSGNGT